MCRVSRCLKFITALKDTSGMAADRTSTRVKIENRNNLWRAVSICEEAHIPSI